MRVETLVVLFSVVVGRIQKIFLSLKKKIYIYIYTVYI